MWARAKLPSLVHWCPLISQIPDVSLKVISKLVSLLPGSITTKLPVCMGSLKICMSCTDRLTQTLQSGGFPGRSPTVVRPHCRTSTVYLLPHCLQNFTQSQVMERKEPDVGANVSHFCHFSSFLSFSRACLYTASTLANISPMCAHSQSCSCKTLFWVLLTFLPLIKWVLLLYESVKVFSISQSSQKNFFTNLHKSLRGLYKLRHYF